MFLARTLILLEICLTKKVRMNYGTRVKKAINMQYDNIAQLMKLLNITSLFLTKKLSHLYARLVEMPSQSATTVNLCLLNIIFNLRK